MQENKVSLFEAQTKLDEIPKRGGGNIVTTLLIYALEKKIIDECLVIKMSDATPYEAVPTIARTRKDIIAASGSKYVFVPYDHLIGKMGKRSAIVGLPCQIRNCPKNFLKIGLFCGLTLSPRAFNYILKKLNIRKEEIIKMDWRAPKTKKLRITLKNGEKKNLDTWWLSYYFTNEKCLYCEDYLNHFSDISVGDIRKDWSVVILRTEKGRKLFFNTIKKGYIKANPISQDYFLSRRMTPLIQKELRGGFINTKLVRVRGKWLEYLPMSLLRTIAKKIIAPNVRKR